MTLELLEIARQLDELDKALREMGRGVAGSSLGNYEIYDSSGVKIDIPTLSRALRKHAEKV